MRYLSPSPVTALWDDTQQLQRAIDSGESELHLLSGTYIISKTLQIAGKVGLRIVGDGHDLPNAGGVRILWAGNNSSPLFLISNSRECVFDNFSVAATSGAPLQTAFQSQNPAGGAEATTENIFRNLAIGGSVSGDLQYGFRFVAAGNDANNDACRFENVAVNNYTTVAWSFEHTQSKAHNFFGCWFVGNQIGQSGVSTNRGSGNVGGSFSWYGGGGGGNLGADFDLGSPNDPILISNANCEASNRFLTTAGPTTSSWVICVQSCRFSGDRLNADGKAIIFQSAGPLNVIACDFGDGQSGALQIFLNPSVSSTGFGIAIGNQIFSSLLHPFTVSGTATWALTGNVQALSGANSLIS